jgi:hypothetical protein
MSSKDKPWVQTVVSGWNQADHDSIASVLLPRIALLRDNKVTQDQSKAGDTLQGLQDIVQRCPQAFAIKAVADECLKLLAFSSGLSAPRDGIVQHQLACSLLMAGHQHLDMWPISLVKAYLDDALQGRRWVDIPQASQLVSNILTAFPGAHDMAASSASEKDQKSSAPGKEPDPKRRKVAGVPGAGGGAASFYADEEGAPEDSEKVTLVRPRFKSAALQSEIASMALETLKRNLDPQPSGDSTQRKLQNLLKVVVLLVVYEPVRNEVVKRLESWVNNPNLVRHLKELMPRLASQCTLNTDMEGETVRFMMRMRPKANATQMHNEALGILCRSNARCPLRALFMFTEMEMKDYESFVHKSNKSLKNSHYISTILKNTGMPHFTADRPPELGGSVERFNVTDLGLGMLEYDVQAPLKHWGDVMGDSKGQGAAGGVILVADEAQVCQGGAEEAAASRVEAAAAEAQAAGASGLVVILASGSQRAAAPRGWQPGAVSIPVLAMLPGQDVATLKEAISSGMEGSLNRIPRESLLADIIIHFADQQDKRAGLSLLLRKIFKTCQMSGMPELDLVALAQNIMSKDQADKMSKADNESKAQWAFALVDVVCFVCVHLASQVVEAGQASVHADRGVGALETRAERAGVRVRGHVMGIMEAVLDSWVHKVLLSFLPRDMLSLALRKLLFYEEASTYSAEPLVLETQERQGIKVLQSQMAVTEKSLLALARLGQRMGQGSPTGPAPLDATMALGLIEQLVQRAVPVACRHVNMSGSDAALEKGAAQGNTENLKLSGERVELLHLLLALACSQGEELGKPGLAPVQRAWQAYLIIVLLAVFNPTTLGKQVWTSVPTGRVMMQMLITATFTFPPIDLARGLGSEGAGAPEALSYEAEARRQDAAVVEQLRGHLASSGRPEPKWLNNSTLVLPQAPARCPPNETLMMLKILDKSHDLGQVLRQTKAPNMLLETLNAEGGDSSCVGWLGAVLER